MTGLEIVAASLAVGGSVVKGMGAIQEADAAGDAARYNQSVNTQNARASRLQGYADAEDQARENRKQIGQIRAAYGASGLEMSGSPLDVLVDTASEQDLDVRRIKYKADNRAIAYANQAKLEGMKARAYENAETLATVGTVIGAGTSLLGSPGVM